MLICCVQCGCTTLDNMSEPVQIDTEINQVLLERQFCCASCGTFHKLVWWEVFNHGDIIISPVSGFSWKKDEEYKMGEIKKEPLNYGHLMYLEVQLEALEEDLDDTLNDWEIGLIDDETCRDRVMTIRSQIADIKIELKQ